MKKFRILPFLMALLMLLCACKGPGGEETDTTTEAETEAPKVLLNLLAPENGAYDIIRPEKASEEVKRAFMDLRALIESTYGVNISPKDDWINPNKPINPLEILVGNCDRDEVRTTLEELPSGSFAIRVINEKLVIVGKTDELTIAAVRYFMENYFTPEQPAVYQDTLYVGHGVFDIEEVLVGGVPIDSYVIVVPPTGVYNDAANAFSAEIEKLCGTTLPVVTSRNEKAAHEIVIGPADRDPAQKKYGYDDTEVYFKDGSLFIGCASSWSAKVGAAYLSTLLSTGEKKISIDAPADGKPLYSFISGSREEYIKDPTKLQMHWAFTWDPVDDLISYDKKVAALNATDKDHLFTVSHRADWIYYPENCIESMISVWAMGGDCVEIDVHFTRDGIAVLMHDDTLTRMTNFSDLAGKNGLPSSNQIADWTYEQLLQLNLKEGAGGAGAAVTPYKIPTLEETLILCKNRFFVILDKPLYWRYVDYKGYQSSSQANYIFPIMEKTGNFESVLISYSDTAAANTLTPAQACDIQKYVYEKTGQKMFFYLRAWNSRSTVGTTASYFEKNSLSNSGILVDGAYNPSKASQIQAMTKKYPNSFFGSWTIADDTDNHAVWEEMYSIGLRSIMTNNMFALVQYAQTKIVK